MLSIQDNETFTKIGPSTRMGNFLRRYWWPIAPSAEMNENPTKEVRILGEDLVLYRDRSGTFGLIDRFCAHRRVNLAYGIPEDHGLRCMYHGWMYNETGQCVEQPFEETVRPEGRFKDKIKLTGYPVEELGGLLWGYLGPAPTPLLPRWDLLVADNVARQVAVCMIPANWLQVVENALDPVHLEWLHGHFPNYMRERTAKDDPALQDQAQAYVKRHLKIGFDLFEHGIIKRRVVEGQTEEDEDWRIGHPQVFPALLRVGGHGRHTFQMRTPVDDTTTMQLYYSCFFPPPGKTAPRQEFVPYSHQPIWDEQGRFITDTANNQDVMVWVQQGAIVDRSRERLGESDRGIIMYRQLLKEQMELAESGRDPMNVFRDPAQNECIILPQEENKYGRGRYRADNSATTPNRHSGIADLVRPLYADIEVR